MPSYALRVNGKSETVAVEADTSLLSVLRHDLGLVGAKYGCGLGQCGACTVTIDGQAATSCSIPIADVADKSVDTVEGLARGDTLHALQRAFIEEQAAQCGYCVAGIMMRAKALLDTNPHPTDAEITEALSANLCRCGTHPRFVRAIARVAGRAPRSTVTVLHTDATGPMTEPRSPSLAGAPLVSSWIAIGADGTVTITTGKVEIGQGIRTALAQICAEELDVDLARVTVAVTATTTSPNEGWSSGSNSIEDGGGAVRRAAAEARRLLLQEAAVRLEVPAERLDVEDGAIRDPRSNRRSSYWEIAPHVDFAKPIGLDAPTKSGKALRVVGRSMPRLDIPAKIAGKPSFIHDLRLPGMAFGRVVRPAGPNHRLTSIDTASVAAMAGVVAAVHDGSFLGVIADRDDVAVRAAARLARLAHWEATAELPRAEDTYDGMVAKPFASSRIVDGLPTQDAPGSFTASAGAATTLTATYRRPFQMHGSLGPSAAVATWTDGRLAVWTSSQGIFPLRAELAYIFGLDVTAVSATHVEGAGCYGHNGADDATLDAALLARAVPGRPVLVQWTREQEHAWEPYGPAMVMTLQASLDAEGRIAAWSHDVWSGPHINRPTGSGKGSRLLAARHLAQPKPVEIARSLSDSHSGGYRNADPLYALPNRRIVHHEIVDPPLRTGSLRGLGAYANIFAIETFMDELADAAGTDPVAFRLAHLADPRGRDVIERTAAAANWTGYRPTDNRGLGFAFGRYKNTKAYAAVVVEVEVDPETLAIRLIRAVLGADAGRIINPDGLANQIEGGFIYAASQSLKEEVLFDRAGVTSTDWLTYPILGFAEVPEIATVLIDRPDEPPLGAGEGSQGPTPAAVANAIYRATGVRLRDLPLTAERLRAAALASD